MLLAATLFARLHDQGRFVSKWTNRREALRYAWAAPAKSGALCLVIAILVSGWILQHRRVDATAEDAAALDLGTTEIDAFERILADTAGELTEPHPTHLR